MIFQSIQLTNYKCYSHVAVDFHPTLNCIVGSNGAGKTNLLDALYYCCFTKSYFSSSDQYVIRYGVDFIRIDAQILDDDETLHVVIRTRAGESKSIDINDTPIGRRSDFIGKFNAVMIAPDDNQIILGGSEVRRKFMDGCIGQYDPIYLRNLLDNQKLLRQRNALLKQNLKTRNLDRVLLETLDERLVLHGDLIHHARKTFTHEFFPVFIDKFNTIAGLEEEVEIEYFSQLQKGSMSNLMKGNLEQDILTGRSSIGPHKDDLKFSIFNRPLKITGSQGQQKSFLVALKLAQYDIIERHKKQKPFLFLDDLFDKFDNERVAHIMELVQQGHFGQVFITDTNEERMVDILKKYNLEHRMIPIKNAGIIEQQ